MSAPAAHTPGPWMVNPLRLNQICGPNGGVDLAYATIRHPSEEVIANARLMAAAPELLEALQRAERMLGDFQHLLGRQGARVDAVLDDARAAIAKARGGAQ